MAASFPSHNAAPLNALEVARYVTDMTAQLEVMAVTAGLDALAYFLGMVKAESDLFLRSNSQAEGFRVESEQIGPVEPKTDNAKPLD